MTQYPRSWNHQSTPIVPQVAQSQQTVDTTPAAISKRNEMMLQLMDENAQLTTQYQKKCADYDALMMLYEDLKAQLLPAIQKANEKPFNLTDCLPTFKGSVSQAPSRKSKLPPPPAPKKPPVLTDTELELDEDGNPPSD